MLLAMTGREGRCSHPPCISSICSEMVEKATQSGEILKALLTFLSRSSASPHHHALEEEGFAHLHLPHHASMVALFHSVGETAILKEGGCERSSFATETPALSINMRRNCGAWWWWKNLSEEVGPGMSVRHEQSSPTYRTRPTWHPAIDSHAVDVGTIIGFAFTATAAALSLSDVYCLHSSFQTDERST